MPVDLGVATTVSMASRDHRNVPDAARDNDCLRVELSGVGSMCVSKLGGVFFGSLRARIIAIVLKQRQHLTLKEGIAPCKDREPPHPLIKRPTPQFKEECRGPLVTKA